MVNSCTRPIRLMLRFCFILSLLLSFPLTKLLAQDSSAYPPIPNISWMEGPTIGKLGNEAIIDVPAGFSFTGAEGTRTMLEFMQNIVGGSERGMLVNDSSSWFVVFEYDDAGYVKDDEQDELDAADIFKTLQEGTRESNKERISRGWDTLILRSWVQEPYYNASTHNLEWGTLLEVQDGSQSVNYFTRFLGRKGYYSITLVTDPNLFTTVLPEFQTAMSGFSYTEGNRYAEFREGDKIAEYGLTALVVGGAGALAAKAGIFKWLWKVIVVAVAGAAGFLKKFFTGRASEAKAPGPPKA